MKTLLSKCEVCGIQFQVSAYGHVERKVKWTLPKPPEGRKWHRNDWTQDMLPEGWRPLLLGEKTSDEDQWLGGSWINGNTNPTAESGTMHTRTRRPLPTPAPPPEPWAECKAAFSEGKAIQFRVYSSAMVGWSEWSVKHADSWCTDGTVEYRIAPTQPDYRRAEFERWARGAFKLRTDYFETEIPPFSMPDLQTAWSSWKAAIDSQSQEKQ